MTHVLQEEMFLRGIQAEHWIQATLPVVSRRKKKEHDRYLNRMATATALACMDMTRHVHVRYDVAGRPVVCFNKEVVVKEAYVVWEYGKDVKVKPLCVGSKSKLSWCHLQFTSVDAAISLSLLTFKMITF